MSLKCLVIEAITLSGIGTVGAGCKLPLTALARVGNGLNAPITVLILKMTTNKRHPKASYRIVEKLRLYEHS